jgi:hypothetical protein
MLVPARSSVRLSIVAFAVTVAGAAQGASAAVPVGFRGGWETGRVSPWNSIEREFDRPLGESFVLVSRPARSGRYAAKFVVRQGYSDYGWGDASEAYWNSNEGEGDDYWYAWSTLFPRDWREPYGWGLFQEWHSHFPNGPPVAFDARANQVVLDVFSGTVTPGRGFEFERHVPLLATLSKGRWNDFVVHIQWTAGTGGSVEVWHRLAGAGRFGKLLTLRGVATLQRKDGVVSTNYVLWGLYRRSFGAVPTRPGCTGPLGVQPPSVVYQDSFVRGRSFAAVVDAAFGGGATAARARPSASRMRPLELTPMGSVTDPGCAACAVRPGGGAISASIGGGADDDDTAYVVEHFARRAGVRGLLEVRDRLRLSAASTLVANLSVLQVRDVDDQLVYELYARAGTEELWLWSPPGGQSSGPINVSTRVRLPRAGPGKAVRVVSLQDDSLTIAVGGKRRVSLRGLTGSNTHDPRLLRVGIDHYDGPAGEAPMTVVHDDLRVASGG